MDNRLILSIVSGFAITLQAVVWADTMPASKLPVEPAISPEPLEAELPEQESAPLAKESRMKSADLPPAIQQLVSSPIRPLEALQESGRIATGGRAQVLVEPERAGFKRYYEEGRGFKIGGGFSVSGRFELVNDTVPVDSYIMAANEKSLRNFNHLEIEDTLRPQLRHSTTRAWATTAVLKLDETVVNDIAPIKSLLKNLPILRYTFDKRQDNRVFDQVLNDFKVFDKWTHEFFLEYVMPFEVPYLGDWVVNAGYQKYYLRGIGNPNSFERRNNWIFNNSFQIDDDRSIFFAYEYFQGKRLKASFIGKTEQHFYRFQWRQRFPDWRLFAVTNYSATREDFRPDPPLYQKHEIYQEFNKDITDKLRATQKTTVIASRTSNQAFTPSKVTANALLGDIKLSYEIIPHLDVSFEYEESWGITNGEFDNSKFLWEVELFRPGLLRTSFGFFWQPFHNIDAEENGVQFRAFLFQ